MADCCSQVNFATHGFRDVIRSSGVELRIQKAICCTTASKGVIVLLVLAPQNRKLLFFVPVERTLKLIVSWFSSLF